MNTIKKIIAWVKRVLFGIKKKAIEKGFLKHPHTQENARRKRQIDRGIIQITA